MNLDASCLLFTETELLGRSFCLACTNFIFRVSIQKYNRSVVGVSIHSVLELSLFDLTQFLYFLSTENSVFLTS